MARGREKEFRIGPWKKGLNEVEPNDVWNWGNAALIDDHEFAEAKNFEVDESGFLLPRRGMHFCYSTTATANQWDKNVTPTMRSVTIIGSVKKNDDEYAIIHSREPAQSTIWMSNDAPYLTSWVKHSTLAGTADYVYACCVYKDVLYFCRSESTADTGSGGYSTPASTIGTAGTLSTQANIPKGNQFFIWKDRAWVCSGTQSKVMWSKATDPTIWAAPDGGFFFASPGDGEVMTDVVLLNNQMYLFKERKAFRFIFNADPALDGTLIAINDNIGGFPIASKDRIFLVSYDGLFQVINDQFINISHGKLKDGNIEAVYRPFIVDDTLYFSWRRHNVDWNYCMNIYNGAFSRLDVGVNKMPATRMFGHKTARFSNDDYYLGNGYLVEPVEASNRIWYMLDDRNLNLDFGDDKVSYVPPVSFISKNYYDNERYSFKKFKKLWFEGKMNPLFSPFAHYFTLGFYLGNSATYMSGEDDDIKTNVTGSYTLVNHHPSTLQGDQLMPGPRRFKGISLIWQVNSNSYATTDSQTVVGRNHTSSAPELYSIRQFLLTYHDVEKRTPVRVVT